MCGLVSDISDALGTACAVVKKFEPRDWTDAIEKVLQMNQCLWSRSGEQSTYI